MGSNFPSLENKFFEPYKLIQRISDPTITGAEIYIAEYQRKALEHNSDMPHQYAIKVLRRFNDPSFYISFQNEAHINATLQHENIPTFYNFGENEGMPYIVMEFASKGSLANLMRPGIPVPIEQSVSILLQIADALEYVHNFFLHRDIKPGNILLEKGKNPRQYKVYLGDFGIATPIIANNLIIKHGTEAAGTPLYMSSEQRQGISSKTNDIFSLGVTAYELFTHQLPLLDVPYGISNVQAPRFESITRVIMSDTLEYIEENVVLKAMNRDSKQRFQSAAEFRDALLEEYTLGLERGARYLRVVDMNVPRIITHTKRKIQNYQEKSYKEVLPYISRILQFEPKNIEFHYTQGDIFIKLGRFEEAVKSYESAISIDPNQPIVYQNLALAFLSLNKYEQALTSLTISMTLDPHRSSTYFFTGVTLMSLQRKEEALLYTSKAFELDPNNLDIINLLKKITQE